jgi:major membrane immunogen (membrane-anchored lipoprotein)
MKNVTFYSLALCSLILSACGETDDAISTQEAYDSYIEGRQDALSVALLTDSNNTLTSAPANDTAQMNGTYAISADSFSNSELVGDMSMTVDFGNETTSGSMTNNYLDPDGTGESEVTPVNGSLQFSGDIDLGSGFVDTDNSTTWQIDAEGSGTLSASDATDITTTYGVNFDLNGDLYDTSSIGEVTGVGEVGDVASAGLIQGSIDVTTDDATTLYDIDSDGSVYFVYELNE